MAIALPSLASDPQDAVLVDPQPQADLLRRAALAEQLPNPLAVDPVDSWHRSPSVVYWPRVVRQTARVTGMWLGVFAADPGLRSYNATAACALPVADA